VAVFFLLLAFALFKVALGLALVWFGLRGTPRDEPDDDVRPPDEPPPPPVAPVRRPRRPRAGVRRGGRDRRPVRLRA
jgi:hypothetical protein